MSTIYARELFQAFSENAFSSFFKLFQVACKSLKYKLFQAFSELFQGGCFQNTCKSMISHAFSVFRRPPPKGGRMRLKKLAAFPFLPRIFRGRPRLEKAIEERHGDRAITTAEGTPKDSLAGGEGRGGALI